MRLRNVSGAERERTIIERQVRHLVSLVDDLLDVSRITRGKFSEDDRVDMADVIAKAIEMTSPAIEGQRHADGGRPRGLVVTGDAPRLSQSWRISTNAAKYTDAGGAIRWPAAGPHMRVTIRIRGGNRARDAAARSSTCSHKSARKSTVPMEDWGGLAIVKSLVLAHRGTVEAHSDGKGAAHGS
jgi:signal transduction histidine kinase